MKKHNKGLTTEYVLLVILLVSVLITVILTSVGVAQTSTTKYRSYIERKLYMDGVAESFLQQKQQGEEDIDLSAFEQNDYELTFEINGNVLQAKRNGKVLLTVEVAEENDKYQFVTYFYGEISDGY